MVKSEPRPVGRPQVAPEEAENFPLRLPPELFAELLAYREVRKENSVNTVIWKALEEWAGRQPEAQRKVVAKRAPEILEERRRKRAARRRRR